MHVDVLLSYYSYRGKEGDSPAIVGERQTHISMTVVSRIRSTPSGTSAPPLASPLHETSRRHRHKTSRATRRFPWLPWQIILPSTWDEEVARRQVPKNKHERPVNPSVTQVSTTGYALTRSAQEGFSQISFIDKKSHENKVLNHCKDNGSRHSSSQICICSKQLSNIARFMQ